MKKLERREASQYSPLALAFLGDAVYEQFVRERLVLEANRPAGELHKMSVERVRAGYQARGYSLLESILTSEELAVLKRGRNAATHTVPKSASPAEYHRATAVECLFGWLSLCGERERAEELFLILWEMGNTGEDSMRTSPVHTSE